MYDEEFEAESSRKGDDQPQEEQKQEAQEEQKDEQPDSPQKEERVSSSRGLRPETSGNGRRKKKGEDEKPRFDKAQVGFFKPGEDKFLKSGQQSPKETIKDSIQLHPYEQELRPYSAAVDFKPGRFFGSPPQGRKFMIHSGSLVRSKDLLQQSQSYHHGLNRNIPNAIHEEKEKMYEDIMHLKQELTHTKISNTQMKTKIQHLEREAAKFEKMVHNETIAKNNIRAPSAKSSTKKNEVNHLAISLKHQVKELKAQLKAKEDEVYHLKRDYKITKYQEMEIQVKVFAEENIKMKETIRKLEIDRKQIADEVQDYAVLRETLSERERDFETLKSDNIELMRAIRMLEDKTFESEKKAVDLEQKLKSTVNNHKKSLKDKDKEIQRLKGELHGPQNNAGGLFQRNFSGMTFSHGETNKEPQPEIKSQYATIDNSGRDNSGKEEYYKKQNIEKDKKIGDLQKEIEHLKNQQVSAQNTIEKLNDQVEKTTIEKKVKDEDIKKLQADIKALKNGETVRSKDESFHPQDVLQKMTMSDSEDFESSVRKSPKKPEKKPKSNTIKPVEDHQVRDICLELNIRMRIKNILIEDLDNVFWYRVKSKHITIRELVALLSEPPFLLEDKEKAQLLARNLVEDPSTGEIEYDEYAKQALSIVKTQFKNKISNHATFRMQELEDELHPQISEKIDKHKEEIEHVIEVAYPEGQVNLEELVEILTTTQMNLKKIEIDYIITKLYEKSMSLTKLPVSSLTEIFKHETERYDPIEDDDDEPVLENEEARKQGGFGNKGYLQNEPIKEEPKDDDEDYKFDEEDIEDDAKPEEKDKKKITEDDDDDEYAFSEDDAN